MSEPQAAHCRPDEVRCALCGDEALEGVVCSVDENRRVAVAILEAQQREVAIDLVPTLAPGDRVMVHQGFVIARVPS